MSDAAPTPPRRPSLARFTIVVAALMIVLIATVFLTGRGNAQWRAAEQIVAMGGTATIGTVPESSREAFLDTIMPWYQPKLIRIHTVSVSGKVDNGVFEILRHFEGLQTLSIEGAINDQGLAAIPQFKYLSYLRLSGDQITDAGLAHLANCTHLNRLNLDDTEVTGTGFRHLRKLTDLLTVSMVGSQLDDAGLAEICAMPRVQMLFVQKTNFTDAGLEAIRKNTSIQWLRVSTSASLTEEALRKLRHERKLSITIMQFDQNGDFLGSREVE